MQHVHVNEQVIDSNHDLQHVYAYLEVKLVPRDMSTRYYIHKVSITAVYIHSYTTYLALLIADCIVRISSRRAAM